jgi:DNA helicase-2/ATP-dependent DNA helicase PcrA
MQIAIIEGSMATTEAFEKAYTNLNAGQKEAVDAVEGPVMVIAGPGTGKTHLLTLRVANILNQTQAGPDAVLVLTFTDSAARTVARRLAGLIGEDAARKVGVYTFHRFAESVMKRHPEAFPEYTDRRLMGEVEQILLWRSVLENGGPTPLRTPRSPYHYLGDLKNLEEDMTRERLSLDDYRAWLDAEAVRIEADPSLRYARGGKGGKAGDLNPRGRSMLERLDKGREAARLIEAYRAEKEARGVYGYTDVLRIAVDGIAADPALRADLQEEYQYVLADEHQDANALQHALLDALAFDEHPNLFIVGDEKQAIFGFQGADATHFKRFIELYPRTRVVTLTENYRSYQGVLDVAHTLLADLPSSTGGHAALSAARGKGGAIRLLAADDPLAERDQVAALVSAAIDEGIPPHEIAVITAKNRTADEFAAALRARGVPTLRAGDIDLEGRPAIRAFLSLMRAVADPNEASALREALLAPWWTESVGERLAFLRRTRDGKLSSALSAAFPRIAGILASLQTESLSMPPVQTLSRILEASGARSFFLARAESLEEDIPLVRSLVMHVEDLARRSPNATFAEVLDEFAKAREHDLASIRTSLTQKEGCVTVITAHKAKGMEFSRVFVSALTKKEWEGRGKSALIPSPFDAAREKEEVIRLFYVALTRAKDELVLSYAAHDAEGREEAPMSLLPPGLTTVSAPASPLPLLHAAVNAPERILELTRDYLLHDGLSPSAMNDYLESPAAFFAKRVLRLREPETRAIVAGNAVHAGVAEYLTARDKSAEERAALAHAEAARCIHRSLIPRGDTFDELFRHVHALVDRALGSDFLAHEPVAVEEVFSVSRNVEGVDVVLKGKVDAVFRIDGGECVVDFKTSAQIKKSDKAAYERQIAFYDLILRENGHNPESGLIVQVTEDELTPHAVDLTDATRADLKTTLDAVLTELVSGTWRAGSPSGYDALLSLLA